VPGTLIDVVSETIAEQWQLAEQTYAARFPSTSQGVQLDYVGQINGIKRQAPQKSTVFLGYQGINGTIIPAGNQVKSNRGDVYETLTEQSIDNTKINKGETQVITVLNNHDYIVFIDDNSVQYTSSGTATIEEITNGIINEINLQTLTLLVEAEAIDVSSGTFYITSNDGERAFTLTLNVDFQLNLFWTPIKIQALVAGALEAEAGTITTIVTPVVGLNAVDNFTEVTLGSLLQTDDNYRVSLFQEVRRLGGGSLEAIKDRILNSVQGVILVRAFENDTMILDPVTGRPPKSIEILVEGGADEDIANELWLAKGGGIETFGNVSVIITDSQGDLRNIKFSRPVKAYIWFRITLTVNTQFPSDGSALIKEKIVLKGRETFGIGDEILIQEFFCPIYEVEGIENAVIEIQKTPDLTPPVSYVTTNITLADNESPLFDITRVEVLIP